MTTINYRKIEPVFYRDREWTEEGLSFYAYPANYAPTAEGGKLTAHDNCNVPEDERISAEAGGDPLCTYNYGQTMAFSPEVTQLGFMNNVEYYVNDDVRVFSSIRANKQTNVWNMAPNAGAFTMPQAIASDKQDSLGLKGPIDSDIQIYYRGVPWGLRQWEEENTLIGGNLGVDGTIGDAWDYTVSLSHTQNKKDTVNPGGFMLISELVSSISAGEFNPFETNLSEDSLAVVNRARYEPFQIIDTQMTNYNATVSGEIFELGGGAAGLAVGLQRADQTTRKLSILNQKLETFSVFLKTKVLKVTAL